MGEPAAAGATSRSVKHALAVDDDTSMLSVVERTLSDSRVSTARDATEALAILSAPERVDLLITDYLTPGMTGEELTPHARATRLGLKVLVITGHARAVERAEPAWWGAEAHLIKPFRTSRYAMQWTISSARGSQVARDRPRSGTLALARQRRGAAQCEAGGTRARRARLDLHFHLRLRGVRANR